MNGCVRCRMLNTWVAGVGDYSTSKVRPLFSTDDALVVNLRVWASPYVRTGIAIHVDAIDTSVVFWKPELGVGNVAAFRVKLAAPLDAVMSELPIQSCSRRGTCRSLSTTIPLHRRNRRSSGRSQSRWGAFKVRLFRQDDKIHDVGLEHGDTSTIQVPHKPRVSPESSPTVPRQWSSVQPVSFIP